MNTESKKRNHASWSGLMLVTSMLLSTGCGLPLDYQSSAEARLAEESTPEETPPGEDTQVPQPKVSLGFCKRTAVSVQYEGCQAAGDPDQEHPWDTDPTSEGEPYPKSCSLVIPVPEEWGFYAYNRHEPTLAYASGWVIEARLRIQDYLVEGNNIVNASFGFSDREMSFFVHLIHEHTGETYAAVCDQEGCHHVEIDWTGYHVYRLTVDPKGQASFYIDGWLTHQVDYQLLRYANIPSNLMVFGSAESVALWDYVRYEICSPSGEPH